MHSLTFPPEKAVCENLILLKPNSLGETLHTVHVQGSHQDVGSRTTFWSRALPIPHTGVDENSQAEPVLSLLSQPGHCSQSGSGPFQQVAIPEKEFSLPWETCSIVKDTNEISDF